jgi:histidinol-phosphatase (PHP family)
MHHWVNYHGHCQYCDGKEAPESYVQHAIEKKFPVYGFSSHSPVPFESTWNMKKERTVPYVKEIKLLRSQYQAQIEIYCGMEVDYLPGEMGPRHPDIVALQLDYTIGSVHYAGNFADGKPWEIDGNHQAFLKGVEEIFDNDIKAAVTQYFERTRQMINESLPDIVGHLDKIKIQSEEGKLFSEDASWYQSEVDKTLQVIKKAGAIIEVNTRGIYKKKTHETYPSARIVKKIFEKGIPVLLSSDAHQPVEIDSEFHPAATMLKQTGFRTLRILHNNTWKDVAFDASGIAFS